MPTPLLTDDQVKRVNAAVAVAEQETAAEIVPVVAAASGRYDRAEDVVGLWTAVVLLIVVWFLLPGGEPEPGSWGYLPAWAEITALVAAVGLGFVLGAILGTKVPLLRRLFTPAGMMDDEVEQGARRAFVDQRLHHAPGRGALLLYVSLFERRAAVLADRALIEAAGGQELVDSMLRTLTEKLKGGGDVATALCDTIAAAADRLEGVLPAPAENINEVPDALVMLDEPV